MSDSRPLYNIYCDESCHLENDDSAVMVLGAVWCPASKRHEIFNRIREIKLEHNINVKFEIKWNKVSPKQLLFYSDIINYFFDNDDLHFRGLIVQDKKTLNHDKYNQDHHTFYYKLFFYLIKVILNPHSAYNIYIDVKDTKSADRVTTLKEALRNAQYDFQKQIVRKIQQVDSKEVGILQITDLLTGAIAYLNRGLQTSSSKLKLIEKIKEKTGYSLTQSTLYREDKFNIFLWQSQDNITK